MANKERYQNPAIADSVSLRLFSYNSNNLADFYAVEKVDIYYLDGAEISDENPDGRRLVQSFDESSITKEDTGKYNLEVLLEEERYTIGKYIDIWTVRSYENQPFHTIEQVFDVYASLWYSTPIPAVYDFSFMFQPNKLRKGSKQYIIVEVTPNTPTAGDLRKYYENLAIVSDLKLTMAMECGECIPAEEDLRIVLEDVSMDYREKRHGYYQLDTEDLELGMYSLTFKLEFGENIYISDKMMLQIY